MPNKKLKPWKKAWLTYNAGNSLLVAIYLLWYQIERNDELENIAAFRPGAGKIVIKQVRNPEAK